MQQDKINKLLRDPLKIINIGLVGFAEELRQQGVETVQVDWAPPAGGNAKLAKLLSRLGT